MALKTQLHFVTFGQIHTHYVNGKTFDKDTVAVIKVPKGSNAREIVESYFGLVFAFDYPQEYWNRQKADYFPKGYAGVNFNATHHEIEDQVTN